MSGAGIVILNSGHAPQRTKGQSEGSTGAVGRGMNSLSLKKYFEAGQHDILPNPSTITPSGRITVIRDLPFMDVSGTVVFPSVSLQAVIRHSPTIG